MSIKHFLKQYLLNLSPKFRRLSLMKFYKKRIKNLNTSSNSRSLYKIEKNKINKFFYDRGYKNIDTSWHRFYSFSTGVFSEKYIPDDIFHSVFSDVLYEKDKWPALLDKNLLETIFKGFKQPVTVVKNINGFFYVNDRQVNKNTAIVECSKQSGILVIKPSVESGGGKNVIGFSIKDKMTSHMNLSIEEMFDSYKKSFIIQKAVIQHSKLKLLNESSLNTLRIMSYIKEGEVHILSSVIRIGKVGQFTDNDSDKRVVCGLNLDGSLKEFGYLVSGEKRATADSNFVLKGSFVPSFDEAIKMVKEMHHKVPYFRIISWDIGIDDENSPVLIEYNTHTQSIIIHQLANGPLFGEYTDELLEIAKQ
jgi:hypothetical protein